jgi:hypothetical protein
MRPLLLRNGQLKILDYVTGGLAESAPYTTPPVHWKVGPTLSGLRPTFVAGPPRPRRPRKKAERAIDRGRCGCWGRMRATLQQRIAGCRKKEVYGLRANVQAIFCRRRHQPRTTAFLKGAASARPMITFAVLRPPVGGHVAGHAVDDAFDPVL